jgi:hypothetical protein
MPHAPTVSRQTHELAPGPDCPRLRFRGAAADLLRWLASCIDEHAEDRAGERGRTRGVVPELTRALERIASLDRVPHRWNGNAGGPITDIVRERAMRFIATLGSRALPMPSVIDPTNDKGISLEWHVGHPPRRKIEIIFLPDDANEWTMRDLVADQLLAGEEDASEETLVQLIGNHVANYEVLSASA